MSILDFTAAAAATPPAKSAVRTMPFGALPGAQNDRPKAQVWINIGYEVAGKFINLPIGLPLDTMDAAEVRGQNADWVKQRNAQNALLEALKGVGIKMQPGEEQTLNLEVRIRRVNEALAVAAVDNEYAVDFNGLVQAKVAAE